jgi:hypothetical protein
MAAQFLAEVARTGAAALVANAPVVVSDVRVAGHLMPMTILAPATELEPSWVVSLRSAYGPYALHEVRTVPLRPVRPLLGGVVKAMDRSLVASGLDRLVCVNNWLLSTNLYPEWEGDGIGEVTEALSQRFPAHFIAFRSLNARHHPALLARFRAAGWALLPARQVWIVDPKTRPTHNRSIDARLLARTALVRASADTFGDADWLRAADLYAQLYVRKYSSLNPVFTPGFLRWAHGSGFMRIEGLRDTGGTLLAVAGTIASHAVMTTPLVGYDLTLPRSLGLYRMAIALSFEDMERRRLSFNISAGVGGFKRLRGALPTVEYTAVWHRHLPATRRLALRILRAALARFAVPLMNVYDL